MEHHILHLRRHLAARDSLLVGPFMEVLGGGGEGAFLGNGIHPDGEAHLLGTEYVKAEEIGRDLHLPENVSSVLVAPSPLARADETARHMFLGMARAYAQRFLRINPRLISSEGKRKLSEQGLHTLTHFEYFDGLGETMYCNSKGEPDGGNELVGQAYCDKVNPNFPGYRWMVQKGFEEDSRSEHPQSVADRALMTLIPALMKYSVVLSATHQPNLEIITAMLSRGLGKDANELFDNAGGAYGMGDGLQLDVYTKDGKIYHADFRRSDHGVLNSMSLNMDKLVTYVKP